MSIEDSIPSLPVVLTIAGFDPSGRAGVSADVRTIAAFGCYPTAAITSLTFQNRSAFRGAEHQGALAIRGQVTSLLEEFHIAGVKTGMLPTREVVAEVVRLFREQDLPRPVVDPVIRSTSGQELIDENALEELLKDLLPLARVVTPNIPEAERIAKMTIRDLSDMETAAKLICDSGARAVLVKGGHLPEQQIGKVVDVLVNEGQVSLFQDERIQGASLRGSGCILSAGIAASLATGLTLEEAISKTRSFMTHAWRDSLGPTPSRS
jgi:hydroxymethylpyrimidine kinase/phosphomethylpyrimidine kinase